jgi:hypothetical protein
VTAECVSSDAWQISMARARFADDLVATVAASDLKLASLCIASTRSSTRRA